MIWFYPDNIESGGKFGLRYIKIRNSSSEWDEFLLCFCILYWPCLSFSFNAINLKLSQRVNLITGYNLCKFYINSLKIEVRTSFLFGKNSSALLLRFTILKFATGSSEWDDITEIVRFRHIGMQKCLHLRNMNS